MSTSYYYFAASLPMLEFGVRPHMSCEDFMEDCERILSPRDFADVCTTFYDGDREGEERSPRNTVSRKWKEFERNFRNEAAWLRATQSQKDPWTYLRGERTAEPYIFDAIVQASRSADPLTAEKILGQAMWTRLEELAQGHYFDIDFIVVYAIKLRILERFHKIDSLEGQKIFEEYKQQMLALR